MSVQSRIAMVEEKGESPTGDVPTEGVTYRSMSLPPSPPSGAATPTLRIAQCPLRLRPLIPPPNYGAVKQGAILRSAFPQDRNVEFLKGLQVKTVLCLVATEPSEAYNRWTYLGSCKRLRIDIAANKEGKVKTTWDSLCEALLIVMDCANYPLYIHCNQGRHRTGCVVACFRKIQRWSMDDILAEYRAYAYPKAREGDIELIRGFDPEAVYDYAKLHGFLDDRPFMRRMDSTIGNIDALAEALSSRDVDDCGDMSAVSNASTRSDDGLTMSKPALDPRSESENVAVKLAAENTSAARTSVVEVGEDIDGASAALDETVVRDNADSTTTVVELAEDAMTPPAVAVSNPFA
ncbi:hypothetical protein LTR08_003402 [Meristemomyces frigidus]|nr:hypothetical protein LTR08_003402 [Meristemomyces frigidus]